MRTTFKAAIAAAGSLAAFVIGTGVASADVSGYSGTSAYYEITTRDGGCEARVYLTGSNQDYAQAHFYNWYSGYKCVFWLNRGNLVSGTTDTVNDYSPIGSYGTNPDVIPNPGYLDYAELTTGQYWDGPDLRVQACVEVVYGSGSNPIHCTLGI